MAGACQKDRIAAVFENHLKEVKALWQPEEHWAEGNERHVRRSVSQLKERLQEKDNVTCTARKEAEPRTEERVETSSELSPKQAELNYKANVKLWRRSSERSWLRRDSWDEEIKDASRRDNVRTKKVCTAEEELKLMMLLLLIVVHLTSAGWIYRVPSKGKEQQIVLLFFQFE